MCLCCSFRPTQGGCWLLALLPANAGQLSQLLADAKRRGLEGYDLIDAVDMWFGHDTPPYRGPLQLLDSIGDQDGRVTIKDWTKAGLPVPHFKYFDKNQDGLLDAAESTSWFLQRQPARTMNLSERHAPPKGHLARLGSWGAPMDSSQLVYEKPYPHPQLFWRKHMDGYLPAVLKGAQAGWPAMSWTREVLIERFGWVDAKLEPKTESRGNDTAYKELDSISPKHRLNVSEYLRVEGGKNVYVVSIIPQVMAWEVAHPAVFLCGSRRMMLDKHTEPPYKLSKHQYPHESGHEWMTHVFEANLWMASGFTRSQLHYDKEWNVNCLLSGRKRWFFLNPFWYDDELQWARGNKFRRDDPLNNRWTDWVYLDPDHVDLIVQHRLRQMDYYELIQEAGDCIFIPYAMLHQVEKLDDGLQVAVSWMFLPETVYDGKACKKAPLDEDLPLAAMDTLYMYTGKGIIPQGYMDPLNFVQQVERLMQERREAFLSLKTLTAAVSRGDAILRRSKRRKERVRKIFDQLTSYAKDAAKGLSKEELARVPLRLWCKPAAEGDEDGPLPCDRGEEYFLCDDEEFKKMESLVQERLARTRSATEEPSRESHRPKAGVSTARHRRDQRVWPDKKLRKQHVEL